MKLMKLYKLHEISPEGSSPLNEVEAPLVITFFFLNIKNWTRSRTTSDIIGHTPQIEWGV
jgi:hypothetical protein